MIVLKIVLIASFGILIGAVLTAVIFVVELQKEIEKIKRETISLNEQNTIDDALL